MLNGDLLSQKIIEIIKQSDPSDPEKIWSNICKEIVTHIVLNGEVLVNTTTGQGKIV